MTLELPIWLASVLAILGYGFIGGAWRWLMLATKPEFVDEGEAQAITFWFAILWPLGIPLFLLMVALHALGAFFRWLGGAGR